MLLRGRARADARDVAPPREALGDEPVARALRARARVAARLAAREDEQAARVGRGEPHALADVAHELGGQVLAGLVREQRPRALVAVDRGEVALERDGVAGDEDEVVERHRAQRRRVRHRAARARRAAQERALGPREQGDAEAAAAHDERDEACERERGVDARPAPRAAEQLRVHRRPPASPVLLAGRARPSHQRAAVAAVVLVRARGAAC